MSLIESLQKENSKLRNALYEALKIDFEKPILLDIEHYEVIVYSTLDRMKRLREINAENPILFEVLDTYLKSMQELCFHFIQDLETAKIKHKQFLSELTNR